jgi:hypothetical protein
MMILEAIDWRPFCPQSAQEAIACIAELVPRMLRSAISVFTRVFDALCLRSVMRC